MNHAATVGRSGSIVSGFNCTDKSRIVGRTKSELAVMAAADPGIPPVAVLRPQPRTFPPRILPILCSRIPGSQIRAPHLWILFRWQILQDVAYSVSPTGTVLVPDMRTLSTDIDTRTSVTDIMTGSSRNTCYFADSSLSNSVIPVKTATSPTLSILQLILCGIFSDVCKELNVIMKAKNVVPEWGKYLHDA